MRSKLRLDFPLPEKYSLAASLPKQKRLKDTPRRDRYSYGYVGREGVGWQRRFSRQTLACILFCNNRRRDQGKDKYKNSLFHAFYPFLLWLSPPSPFLLGRLKRVEGDRAQDWSQLEKQGLSERRNPYRPQELLRCARTHQRWQLGNRIDISVQDVDYKQRASVTSEVQEARALQQERKERLQWYHAALLKPCTLETKKAILLVILRRYDAYLYLSSAIWNIDGGKWMRMLSGFCAQSLGRRSSRFLPRFGTFAPLPVSPCYSLKFQSVSMIWEAPYSTSHIVNFPTGLGKYLIYQAIPLISDVLLEPQGHIAAVISPRVNLMKDQVEKLTNLGIAAATLSEIEEGNVMCMEKGLLNRLR